MTYYPTESSMVPIVSPLPDQSELGFVYCGLHTNVFHVIKGLSKDSQNSKSPKAKIDMEVDGVGNAIN